MKKFLREAFSESDGTGSFGRLMSGVLFLSIVGWITYLLIVKKTLPDAVVVAALGGFAMLPYGAAKAAGVITDIKAPTTPPSS